MGVKELYEQRKKAQQSTRYNGVKERWMSQNIEGIATKLSNQINSYVEKNNMYLTDYQNRYSSRKGTYDDPYVPDSGSWLESMQSRKNHFDMERESIMSALNEYGSYMDKEWVNSVMETLNSASTAQSKVLEAAQGDADFWSNFADENEYNKWSQGLREYDTKWGNLSKEADFADLSKYDPSKNKEEPFFRIGRVEDDIYRLVNDDAYRTTKQADAVRSGGGSEGTRKAYGEMTDDEVATFNYVYSKYGEEKAMEYLADIEENLNRKQADRIFTNFEDDGWLGKAISYPALSVMGGLDQAAQGTAQVFSSDRLPTSTMSYVNQSVSENLDGFGKALYTAGNTVGNMLPSIAVSIMSGGVASGLGLGAKAATVVSQGLGSATMGLSSSGNAYNQALAEGYSKEQARAYSVLVGASEATLQYLLGGISSLGGKVGLNAGKIAAKVGMIDHFLPRIAAKYAMSIGSEILEEEAQLFLEPAFRSIIFGEDYDLPTTGEMLETALVTALSTGFLESSNIVGGEVAARAVNRKNLAKYGDVAGDLTAEALALNPENKYAQKVQRRLDKGKAAMGNQITNLLQQNREGVVADDKAKIQQAAEKRLMELGETGNIQEIAAALTKQAAGERLGVRERSIIKNSTYGQRVSNELNTDKIASGETAAEWVQSIGTGAVRPEVYGQYVKIEEDPEAPIMGRRERALSKPESIRWPGQQDNVESEEMLQPTDQTDGKLPANETAEPEAEENAEIAQSSPEVEVPKADLEQPQTDGKLHETYTQVTRDQVTGKLPTEDAAETPEQTTAKLETASQKYGRQAKAMVANYEPGQDIEEYDAAFKAAYEMGKAGVTKSYLGESSLVEYLTPTQREIAYEAGEAAAAGVAQRIAAKNAKGINGQTGWKKGVVRGDNVSLDELQAISNDTQKIAYKLLSTYAEATGIDIVLYKSEADAEGNFQGAPGKYNWNDPGTIYIDVNAGLSEIKSVEDLARYTMLRTFAHEFTHFIEKWNPEGYNILRKAVFDTLTERGENVDQLIQAEAEKTGLSYERASREVVAEGLTDVLPDAHFAETLANNHKNLCKKLLEKLKDFLKDLRGYFKSLTTNTDFGAAALKQQVGETVRYVENIVEVFDKAAVSAVENYQKTVAVAEETAVEETAAEETVTEAENAPSYSGTALELYNILSVAGEYVFDGFRYSVRQDKQSGKFYGNIKRERNKTKGYPVANARDTVYSSYTPGFATREEALEDLIAVAKNNNLLEATHHEEKGPVYLPYGATPVLEDIDAEQREKDIASAKAVYGISDEESQSLELYVAGAAFDWTRLQRTTPESEWSEYERTLIAWCQNGLSKLPKYNGTTYRNMSFSTIEERDKFLRELQTGDPVPLRAFTSSSKDPNGYVVPGEYVVHMVINGVSGHDMSGTYSTPKQKEVVFLPGVKMKQTILTKANDGHPLIYVQEVADNGEKLRGNHEEFGENPTGGISETVERDADGKRNDILAVPEHGRGQGSEKNGGRTTLHEPRPIPEEVITETENKEEVSHGKESENGLDDGTVREPVLRSDEATRLLEGMEPSAVQRGGEGRGSVRTGVDEGTEDAGRDRRADTARNVSERGPRDRVGGDLQQLPELSSPETEVKAETETEEQRKAELHEEVKQQIEQKSTVEPSGSNFVIGDSLELPSGTKARVRANIQALRLIKQLNAEGRNATAEEQVVLSKYVGWGGLADAFGKAVNDYKTRKMVYEAVPGLEAEFEELKTLLTEDEYRAARESTKNAHYTSVEVIKAMYDGLAHLGFTGGRMLEPSSGVGNFVGAMPPAMSSTVKSWTMVELDKVTGQIAKYLYPHADVRIQGFEQTNIPDGYMDVAIGNVPFGDYAIIDKKYPKAVTSAIHNYFFAKALDKVRPGGIVMFITSSYTMNGRDNAVRKYIMQRADLLGAVRLPNTAFSDNAGTSVVTDILVLKKREERTEYAGEAFESITWQSLGYSGAYVNEYFINHPEMVLGTPTLKRGMYSANELTYDPLTDNGSLGDQIRKAMETITGRMDYKAAVSPEKANFAQERAKKRNQKLKVENGVIKAVDENGNVSEVKVDTDTAARIAGAVAIRDAHTALADALQQGVIDQEVKRLRKALNQAYDSFVQKYGVLHAPKNQKALRQFADRYSILSLENYNAETKKATKTDIFTKNTIAANRTAQSAENVEEGLTISLNATGAVDTSLIARLTGQRVESVTRQLIDQRLVFKDKDGNLIPAAQYLSGNVRAKLREMEGLVGIDKDYQNNVEALKAVVPETVPYTDIYVNPGANWIPVSVYQDFVGHILNRRNHESYRTGKKDFEVEYVPETNEYKVSINDAYAFRSAQNMQVWGESGKSFGVIFENMLNGRRTNVYRKDADGNSVLDKAKTEAVAEKVEKLNEEFRNWLWSDESRQAEMQELYNESYNALVNPKYSGEGLTVNGLNSAYTIRPHQAEAVSRIINSGGNTLLAHRVGAGKTLEMAAAAMKLKQLGIIKKPMFVVPNNVVSQWGEEFKSYFPAANILVVGDEDMTPAERMTTINRIKNNDYDAVILAYTKFEKIPMSESWRSNFYNEQIENILFAMNAEKEAGRGKGFSVKQLEKKRKVLENKIKKLTDKSKDEDGAMFEDLGVDALFVDEAHNFKNLEYTTRMSNVSGLGNADGSQRAFDMYTKIRYLQKLNGGKGIVFATATPVMNSMTEMYIMQRYLQPDTMSQLGIDNFDSWAKMFGEVVNALEISPSGTGYRLKQTFSKFKNIKALQQLFRSFTDVLTDIPGLKIPKMKGGKVQIVECEQSEFQENFMKELAERAENVKNVDPSEDNMLKITSDGRKIAYSQRMIDPSLPYEDTGKIYKCCENVFQVWEESKANKGTQMIFCDMATPKGKATTKAETETDEFGAEDAESAKLYDDMKARLIQLGIPEKEIAFIHDAKNDKQKSKLAEKMNDGTIRVLIGSTGKMGVGLNAQIKAVAIHHLDAPWRPGDIEQRDGRVFRQKNENAEAYKFVYVTKGSFDSRLWDILERKQKFINQIMSGADVGNEVEDTGEVTLSAAEVKAVASGSPLIMEEVALSKEISKLESLQQAHTASVNRAKGKIVEDQKKIAEAKAYVANLEEDLKKRIDTYSDKKFAMQIGAKTYTDKKEAGEALIAAATAKAEEGHYTQIGKFAGFTLNVAKTSEGIKGIVRGAQTYDFKTYPLNPTYGIGHLVAIVEGFETRLEGWKTMLQEAENDMATQQQLASATFEQADKLKEKRARYQEVMDILNPPTEQSVDEDDIIQEQERTQSLSDREVLEMAASEIDVGKLNADEQRTLDTFKNRLSQLYDLQTKRIEEGRLYKEQQFGHNVDRAAAAETKNRMAELDSQIKRASAAVLEVEQTSVLQGILQKARVIVTKQERAHGEELHKRYVARQKENVAVRKYRERITKDVADMTKWALHPDGKDALKHIPDALKTPVLSFLTNINFASKQQLRGGQPTKADIAFVERLEALQAAMKANQGKDLEELYSGYNDLPADFMDNLEKLVSTVNAIVRKNSGRFDINAMSSTELNELSKVVKTLKHFIKNFNKFHANAMFQHVDEAGDNSIDYLESVKPAKHSGVSNFLLWQQMRPAYAFERFGAAGKAIYDGLRRGQAKLGFHTKEIKGFSEDTYTAEEVKAWEKEVKTLDLSWGKAKLTVAQMMGFYELSKQEDSVRHILQGGLRVATFKNGKEVISDVGHPLTTGDVATIVGALTDRQKEVADKLQQYMAKVGGSWGNRVSMVRFGEELFGNPQYYPINSDGRVLPASADELPNQASLYALLNMGFTKSRQQGANNRIVLFSIFDVFSNHMASMAQYSALSLPILDALKWLNYSQVVLDEDGKKHTIGSVRDGMAKAYGTPEEKSGKQRKSYAESFVTNIIKAFNGTEAQGTPYDSFGMKTLHTYNRAQVAFNLRVVVQQPMAITRAGLILDQKSILRGMKMSPSEASKNIKEMQKYSGIAAWKELGFYDVNISRGVSSIIKHDETLGDKIADKGLWLAEKADQLTWAAIWNASKEEVTRKQGLKPGDEGFFDAVTEIFEDVIYKTQVVDSVLTKNEFLRDKGFFARMLGSFMSEPSTTASMMLNAYDKYHMDIQRGMSRRESWLKNRGLIGRTTYVFALGGLLLSAVQALADAWRDDDDYQTFSQKWVEAFGGNILDELSPLNKVPIGKELWEFIKGIAEAGGLDAYAQLSQYPLVELSEKLFQGAEILMDKVSGEETNYTWWGGIYKLLQAASGLTGLPMASATREATALWNNVIGYMAPSLKVKTYETSELSQIKYSFMDGFMTANEAVEAMVSNGISVSVIKSQIGTWYRDQEIPRDKANELLREYTDLSGDEITKQLNEWSAKVVTGIAYDDIRSEFLAGNLTAVRVKQMYMLYGGLSEEEAMEKVELLQFIKANPKTDGISYAAVKKYKAECEKLGIKPVVYFNTWKYKNSASNSQEVRDYINSLDIPQSHKRKLLALFA